MQWEILVTIDRKKKTQTIIIIKAFSLIYSQQSSNYKLDNKKCKCVTNLAVEIEDVAKWRSYKTSQNSGLKEKKLVCEIIRKQMVSNKNNKQQNFSQ